MSIDASYLLRVLIKSGVEFKKSVKKAVNDLGGLEEVTDLLDEEGLAELEEDKVLTGTLGDIMGSLILNWVSKDYPELPEPSIKVRLWKALARSSRKPLSVEDLEAVLKGEEE